LTAIVREGKARRKGEGQSVNGFTSGSVSTCSGYTGLKEKTRKTPAFLEKRVFFLVFCTAIL
jgi:hypothetical protein